jgi:hypothetical protein
MRMQLLHKLYRHSGAGGFLVKDATRSALDHGDHTIQPVQKGYVKCRHAKFHELIAN